MIDEHDHRIPLLHEPRQRVPAGSPTRQRRVIFACLSGLVLVGLGALTTRMYPVERGTSSQFWRAATGVDADGITKPGLGDVHCPGDGWCYYELQGFHGSALFRVPEGEVANDLPRVVEVCQEIAADHTLKPELREVLERSIARLRGLAASGRIAPASRDHLSALIRETEEIARGNEFRPEAHDTLIRLKNDLYGIGLDHYQQDPALYEEMSKVSGDLADVAWHNYLHPHVRAGLERFLRRDETTRQSVRSLVEDLERARLDFWKKESPDVYSYCLLIRQAFEGRRERLQWFWATWAFEWLFFSGLAAYLVWPLFRGWDWRCWILHVSFLPVLLMLPAYFRYATLSFTSAGPTGGVLYPWLACCFRGGAWNSLDRALVHHLPPVLEPLTQGSGMPLSLSGGMPGPTSSLTVPILAVVGAYVVPSMWRRFRRDREKSK